MNNINCFDVASIVIEEANKQFAPIWRMNTERYCILKQYCDVIDKLCEEYDGESYEVEVDDVNMTISITLVCFDMVIEGINNNFSILAKRAISLSFASSDEGNLAIKFTFPSLWERI